ncbi:MAG: threonine synthase [Phycisphaerales bacterium]|nr:threonine synthase [Phycisphaerales bacterium]
MLQRCIACEATYPLDQVCYTCAACGGLLEVRLGAERFADPRFEGRGVWRYASMLPGGDGERVSLREGDTGLYRCDRLGAALGVKNLYIKNEGDNPTGSFKDRGMTVGVTWARRLGFKTVACASTGNTSASMAAFAARAGMRAIVLIPDGKIAMGKLAQAIVHGAEVVRIRGDFDDAMRLVRELSEADGAIYLLNSINPFRLEGQKTLAFEVVDSLGAPPDAVIAPMGNAGNISAIWKGFTELECARRIERLPRMIGAQAEHAAPIVRYLRESTQECRVANAETLATAIRIGAPVNWPKAVAAIRDSGGEANLVTDDEIIAAQRRLAREEGLFVEPASAAPIAYLARYGVTAETVVCVCTGHGLKDPDAVLRMPADTKVAEPTMASLRAALEA